MIPIEKTTLLASIAAVLAASSPALSMDNALRAGLLKLDPQTRLEQRCDAEVLDRISHDERAYKADRVVAYAFATPQMGPIPSAAPALPSAARANGTGSNSSARPLRTTCR